MKKYLIALFGCDDTTKCEIELTENQLKDFIEIARQVNKKSTYQCEPSIGIFEKYSKDEDGYISIWDDECVDLLEAKGE